MDTDTGRADRVPLAVPIVAGTAMKGLAATVMMRRVLERHPNAFLITLASFGMTLPLTRSQLHLEEDIREGLVAQGSPPDGPVVLVGHSQGALACLRYAIDHREQVQHVISVGPPWNGSRSAKRLSGLLRRTGRDLTPALTDMAAGSRFLTELHAELPLIAERVTNIYSTHEIVISPYVAAHIDVPGVTNILIASKDEYGQHLRAYRDLPVQELIEGRVTHLGEMSEPRVRAIIWEKVDEISALLNDEGLSDPPSEQDEGESRRA